MMGENCFSVEQDHPEFPLQKEGQSGGTESSERGSVSSRKTDRSCTSMIWMTMNSKKPLKNARRKIGLACLWTQPCHAKMRFTLATGSWLRRWLHLTSFQRPSIAVKSHESTRQRVKPSLPLKTRRSHRRQRTEFDDPLQSGSKVYSYATSDENSGCTSSSGQGMEEVRDNSRVGFGTSQKEKGGYSGRTQRQKESPLCYIDGKMSPQERGAGTQLTDVHKQSRAPGRHCKRWLWRLCSFFWAGLVSISNDCRRSDGCDCKTNWLWRTSSWCSTRVHSGKDAGRSQIAQNSKVRIQTYGCVFHDTKGRNHGQAVKIVWYLLNETCTVIHEPDCCGKDSSKKFYRVYSKTQILLEILKTLNQRRRESYVSFEVEHLFPEVGCAKNKRVLRSLKSSRCMLDFELMDYLLTTSGVWWQKCYNHRRVPNHQPMEQQETARKIPTRLCVPSTIWIAGTRSSIWPKSGNLRDSPMTKNPKSNFGSEVIPELVQFFESRPLVTLTSTESRSRPPPHLEKVPHRGLSYPETETATKTCYDTMNPDYSQKISY